MNPIAVILGWIWALPTTVIGLVIAIVGGALPEKLVGPERAWVWRIDAGLLHWLFPRLTNVGPRGVGAQTIGVVILLMPGQDQVIAHERAHVRQAFALGPFYLPVYGLSSLWAWASGGNLYRDNWMERQARDAAVRELADPKS